MDDVEKTMVAREQVLAKRVTDNALDDMERLGREVEHQLYLTTGLSVMAIVILAFMLWWGVSGVNGSNWSFNSMVAAYIAVGVLALFAFIAASNIRGEIKRRVESLRRSVEMHDQAIPKYE